MKSARRLAGVAAALLCAGTAGSADTITAAMEAADSRLGARVTVREPHVRLGELLEMLHARTNVDVSMDPREKASGTRLLVYCSGTRLADLLDCLWSMQSLRGAPWSWERTGKAGSYGYRLTVTPRARGAVARMRAAVEEAYLGHADVLMRAAALPAHKRAALPGLSSVEKPLVSDETAMACVRAFVEAVPVACRRQVLLGHGVANAPVDKLPAAARDRVLQQHRRAQPGAPDPAEVTFWAGAQKPHFCHQLSMGTPQADPVRVLGGEPLERALQPGFAAAWMLPGDLAGDKSERSAVAAISPWRANGEPIPTDPFGRTVRDLADGAHIRVVAALPTAPQHLAEVGGSTVAHCLASLRAAGAMHKWRGGILLLKERAWFHAAEWTASRDMVKFAQRIGAEGRPLSWSELARLVGALTLPQLQDLAIDCPAVCTVPDAWWVLYLLKRFPGAAFPDGLAIDPTRAVVLQGIIGHPISVRVPSAARVRVTVTPAPETCGVAVSVRLLGRDGGVVSEVSFPYGAREAGLAARPAPLYR